jgi:hypothetical protein
MATRKVSISINEALFNAALKHRVQATFSDNFSAYVTWLIKQDVLGSQKPLGPAHPATKPVAQ